MTNALVRVMFVCPVSDFRGGAEVVLRDMWRNPGIAPMLAVPAEGPLSVASAAEGIGSVVVSFGAVNALRRPLRATMLTAALRDWFVAARMLKIAARVHGAQVLHSNGMKAHCIAVLARMLGAPPVLVHFHDLPIYKMEGVMWRLIARIATRAILVSRACWPGGKLLADVAIVHNGFVSGSVTLEPPPLNTPIVVGFCGRLHPFKGLHVLPGWLAAARGAGLDVKLVIRGEGTHEHANYVADVRNRFKELGLDEHVDFQGRREELSEIYRGLHVVVVPSDTPDPLPRTVMEAMGLGLPVIGYPAGGIPEMIDHNRNGWLVANEAGFVEAIQTVAGDPSKLMKIRAAARATITQDFSMATMYARLNEQYALTLA